MATNAKEVLHDLEEVDSALRTLYIGGRYLDPEIREDAIRALNRHTIDGRLVIEWRHKPWDVEFPNIHLGHKL